MSGLAFDKSARHFDADGRLHVAKSHISKATVNPYYGKEIPGYEALGLDPDRVYQLLRDPAELEKAAPTFARLPVLREHVPVTVESPRPDLVVGAIGSDVTFDAPYLDADLSVWDNAAIAGIESGTVRELSCAYRYVPVMQPGEFEGKKYDGRMTEIKGNHLALVEVGRAGADVVVADRNPFFKQRNHAMKMTKAGKALFLALCAASPVLAADSALPALVGNAARKTFDKDGAVKKLLALDATLSAEQLDGVIDAILGVEQEPENPAKTEDPKPPVVSDEGPAEKIRNMLAGKVDDALIAEIVAMCSPAAEDEYPPKDEGKKIEAAMDSLRAEFKAAALAAREVRSVVGDVAMDSAAEIYGFALDHLKVDREGVTDVTALRKLFAAASSAASRAPATVPHVAQDAAGLAEQFPGLSRFTRA